MKTVMASAVSRREFLRCGGAVATAVALGAPAANAADQPRKPHHDRPRWRAQPFALDQVRLLDGPFLQARERARRYLMSIPNDRLLHSFRLTAGLPSTAKPLGGWESPNCEIRGHFTGGHYLSACALMYAATADGAILDKANALVGELAHCQRNDGYLGAYPSSFYDRLGRGEWVWVPIYTAHKIIAGHLAMAIHCGNQTALRTATRMADWLGAWMDGFDDAAWAHILKVEFGGMGETLLDLHETTGEERYKRWGLRFDQPSLLQPLQADRDVLVGLHANTHIPKVIAAARAWETGGSEHYREAAGYFWRMVTGDHCYCTGGTSDYEHWGEPGSFAGRLSGHSHECCCSYNMLRLTRQLHGWQPDAALMDYYERVLFNARLGTQDDAGMMMYFVPMDAGYCKAFNKPFDAFWCCTGTGVEEFAKSNDTIYFRDGDGLFVNLFIASELSWPEQGLRLVQRTRFPDEEGTTLEFGMQQPRRLSLRLRIPYWTKNASLKLNGKAQEVSAKPGSYHVIEREFADGDRIELGLPMDLHAAPLPDEPSLQAMMYGPLVLAARLGSAGVDPERIHVADPRPSFNKLTGTQMPSVFFEPDQSWAKPLDLKRQIFEATGIDGPLQLIPLYRIRNERYAVYCRARPTWEIKPQF